MSSRSESAEGVVPATSSNETGITLDWAAIRKAVRCQRDRRDRDDITEWKQEGQCLFVEDRLPWLIAEQEAEGDAE